MWFPRCSLVYCFFGSLVFGTLAQDIPWILPWDDSTGGVTGFSSLNGGEAIHPVTVDADGHFAANGKRVRFLGVNFAGNSPFMPTNYADSVAARLAKFGVNNVRFHHMDAAWAYNGGLLAYSSASSTNINAENLGRLQFVVSRLKTHGIYSDINLLVGREYRAGDGLGPEVAGMDWKDAHILGFFYPPALALQKDYATRVLTPTNRFTGLPLAKDPAVAFVEIINENGILQKWLDGGLDRLPARYATSLQARWNAWLRGRYSSDASMLSAWNVVDQPLGTNFLVNGGLTNGLAGWNMEQHNNARAVFSSSLDYNGAPSAKVTVTAPDTQGWYIQLNYPGLRISSNQIYTISFAAKSSPATNADVSLMQAHADWTGLGYAQAMSLTTNWQRFSGTFQPSAGDTNARVNFGSMGNKLATFWFADVRLQGGGRLGILPDGSSLATGNVPVLRHVGTGYTGTQQARRDWVRFLRELEANYYSEMVGYLRTNVGYNGLIFGTIMANSPASVQAQMDVIDGHAYWQHPQFPGQPWDAVNWFVPNVSMVNTLDNDNTLTGLARQRIKGKPFTVTEYQHPSPNYYGAEGPLLLAAYAGLQDWDGIWLFDYGQGNPADSMGYVRGFFDTGQHPTKMANLLLAANLFRRADVQAARQEYTMALSPERELDLLERASAWAIFSSSQLGMPGKLAFINRLSTSVGTSPPGLSNPPVAPLGNALGSDTGELQWDTSRAGRGFVTVNTARTKAAVGFVDNQSIDLGGLTLRPGTTKLGWCSLGVTLMRGEVLTNDCTGLIVATGWWENTGQVWSDTNRTSVGNRWGTSPVRTEVVPFTLTLPVGTNYVRVWSLTERGQRKAELPVTGDGSSSTLSISATAGSVWYELQVGRWMTSFDLWRSRYFSVEELADPGLSGEAAAPDGDNVPNLLKYYLGLPGRVSAPSDRIPRGRAFATGNQQYLSITFDRDKLADDVLCEGQVSPDLTNWLRGAAFTGVEAALDLGPLERITIRDLTSFTQAPQHYMRLEMQRR